MQKTTIALTGVVVGLLAAFLVSTLEMFNVFLRSCIIWSLGNDD